MTQDELLLLQRGRVPAQPILAAVIQHVREQGHDRQQGLDLQYLEIIAEKAECSFTTLVTWVERPERAGPMVFDVADKLLCACHLWGMWYSDFREYYEAVDLGWKCCEREGCLTTFKVFNRINHWTGPKARRYCGRKCAQMAWLAETGQIATAKKHNSKTHCRNMHLRKDAGVGSQGECLQCERDRQRARKTHCKRNHEFTEANTMILGNGRRKCRTCHNERSLATYHASKEAMAA